MTSHGVEEGKRRIGSMRVASHSDICLLFDLIDLLLLAVVFFVVVLVVIVVIVVVISAIVVGALVLLKQQ